MPSGKKSKEARRIAAAPPPVRSKGGSRRRQANPKVLAIAGAVAALAAIGIVLGVTLGGGSKKTATVTNAYPAIGTLTNALPAASDVNTLFKGIPQSGFTLGDAKAPVTLVEYIDLQCPFCQQLETQVMPDIIKNYVRTNKVRVEVRVLAFIGPDSSRGRKAMIATATQNKAFNFAELLYYNQAKENSGWLSDSMVGQAVSSIPGLKVHQVLASQSSGSVASKASEFDTLASSDHLRGTPTLYVGKSGTKGVEVSLPNFTDGRPLVTALDNALG
jgi:protein-disulfide isomerase